MQYEVRALGRDRVTTLRVEALDEADARRQVAAQALKPLSVAAQGSALSWKPGQRRSAFSLLLFTQELLVLLEAGLSIVESLEAMAEKERRPDIRNILLRLLQNLREGRSFSAALAAMGEIFPPLYVSIVRAAERTSNLPEALSRYSDYRLRLDAVRAKVVSASIYPLILLAVGLGVTGFLLGYVVPRFAGVYHGTGRQIPWLSAQLMAWGEFAGQHRLEFMLGALVTLGGSVALLRHFSAGGRLLQLLQRLPVLADAARTFQLARLYLTLGMLLDGGLPVVQGLALVAGTVPPEMRLRIAAASESIQRGESISLAFDRCGLTTAVGLRMLRVGEQSGRIGAMMARIARVYDAEVTRFIDLFSRIFEPGLMVAIGVVVGLIVVLLYMPIFDLAGSLQ